MKARGEIDLALGVLDHQLLDSEGRRCGKVDDLELDGIDGAEPTVTALLTGAPAWRGRGRMGRLAAAVARGRTVKVRWEDVDEIGAGVHLRRTARELRLGRGDDRAAQWIERVPGAGL